MERQGGIRVSREAKKRTASKEEGSVNTTVRSNAPIEKCATEQHGQICLVFVLMAIIFRLHQREPMFSDRVLEIGFKA